MNEENTQPGNPQPSPPELNISDLNNVRTVLETAVRRGAFQASELSAVGTVYDKLNTFLNAITTKTQPETQGE